MTKNVLTQEQLDRQSKASAQMRKDFTESIKMFLDDIGPKNYDKIGILLSGGVDSTVLLWNLLDLGVRPHVYTYTTPQTDGISTDHRKAKQLADHYRLPITVANLPNDPDYVAQTIEDTFKNYLDCWRKTRPDKEVPFIMHEMGLAAAKDGVRYLFSGIAEGNIHRLSRKMEIRARAGKTSRFEVAIGQVNWATDQCRGLSRMLSDIGIRLLLPHFHANAKGAFVGLSWDELNKPRKKEATLVAYKKEIDLSGINPQVSPMQSGNSGAREYFDEMIISSKHAFDFTGGRKLNTSMPFYNALENRYRGKSDGYHQGSGQSNFEVEEKWSWAAHVGVGAEIEDQYKESLGTFIDLETGDARHPKEVYPGFDDTIVEKDTEEGITSEEVEFNSNDMFGILFNDEDENDEDDLTIIKEENGEYTKNVDCLGYPLYIDSSQRDCPFATSGQCKKYQEVHENRNFKLCSSYYVSLRERADLMRLLNEPYSIDNGAYSRSAEWIEKEADRLEKESRKIL